MIFLMLPMMVMMVVMMLVLVMLVLIVVIVVMVMMMLMLFFIMMVMVMFVLFFLVVIIVQIQLQQVQAGVAVIQRVEQRIGLQLGPGRGHQRRLRVQLTDQGHRLRQFFVAHKLRAAQDDSRGTLHLVFEKFTEILQIDLTFLYFLDSPYVKSM